MASTPPTRPLCYDKAKDDIVAAIAKINDAAKQLKRAGYDVKLMGDDWFYPGESQSIASAGKLKFTLLPSDRRDPFTNQHDRVTRR